MGRRSDLRAAVARRFLLLFLPVALLVAAGGIWMLAEDAKARQDALSGRQVNHLAVLESLVEIQLEPVLAMARQIVASPHLQELIDQEDPARKADLETDLDEALAANPAIERLRVLDRRGRLLVEAHRSTGGVKAAAVAGIEEGRLQGMPELDTLRPGQVQLFSVELAREGASVAQPPRPILPFAAGIDDAHEGLGGVLLVELRLAPLLALLARPFVGPEEKILVADARGFWLVGPRPATEWGFALPERAGETVESVFPELWRAFSAGDFGTTVTPAGRFEHRRIRLATLARPGWSEKAGWGATSESANWWVISWLPGTSTSDGNRGFRRNLVLAFAAILAMLAMAALGEARSTIARRRAERDARHQLELMEILGETLASPVFVKNREERYTAVNKAYEELLGLPRASLLGRTDREAFPGLEVEQYERGDRDALSGSGDVRYETRVEVEGEAARQVEVLKKPFRDSQGRILGLVGVVHDITGLRAAQARLADSEARFRAMIEGSLDLIFLLADGARIEYANPRAEATMGWPQEELVGRVAMDLIHPDDAGLARQMVRLLEADPAARPRLEVRLASRRGEWLDMEAWASRLEAGDGRSAFLVVAHDIRDRKRAQRELGDSRARLQRVLEHMPVMLSAVGEDGRYAVWNRECERVTGYSLEELAEEKVGSSMARMFPDPVDLDRLRHEWAAREGEFRDWEMEIVCKDGSRKITSWSSIARQFPISGWRTWSIAADVTDRRRAESERAVAMETLRRWVEKLQHLNALDDLLHACRSLTEADAVLQRTLPPLFSAAGGQLYRPEPGSDELRCVVSWGGLPAESLGRTTCWGLRVGRPHLVSPEGGGVPCTHVDKTFTGATLCAPIVAQGEVLGLLHLRSAAGDETATQRLASELQLAQMVAGHLGLRLAALGLREALEYRSTRDPLTGLFNRRYFEETLARELARSARHGRPLAIVMVDIDHFKRVNDTCGHAVGDLALREIAAALQRGLRSSDVAARWGGEEFLLLLPEATVPPAAYRAEQLRLAVMRMAQETERGLPAELTISAGVAVYPLHANDAESLLRAADAALYRAKAGGRNRVETAG